MSEKITRKFFDNGVFKTETFVGGKKVPERDFTTVFREFREVNNQRDGATLLCYRYDLRLFEISLFRKGERMFSLEDDYILNQMLYKAFDGPGMPPRKNHKKGLPKNRVLLNKEQWKIICEKT